MKTSWFEINFLTIFYCAIFLINIGTAVAEENVVELTSIIVTSEKINARNVYTINSREIDLSHASSIEELLTHVQGVDTRKRGTHGVQSDISIRGGTPDQVLILLDGVSINDPQTSHHNMDIPVPLENIDSIEIIKGGISSIYGANAFTGVINIKTKKPESKKSMIIEAILGEHSLSKQLFSISYPIGKFDNQLTFQRKESSAYKPETEFNIRTFFLKSLLKYKENQINCTLGYTDKDFGADSFYSSSHPREEEHTNTKYINLNANFIKPKVTITPTIFYRRHGDKYILDRTRPSWYVNHHTSYLYGTNINLNFDLPYIKMTTGIEIKEEKIDSTQIGNHKRDNESIFFDIIPKMKNNFILNLSLNESHYGNWGWKTSPGISMGYIINSNLKIKSSIVKSFRIPNFTELYYNSPANKGNTELTPEKNISYEIGLDFDQKKISGDIVLFKRKSKKVIDWVKENSLDSDWESQNLGTMDTYGIEFQTNYIPEKYISELSLNYTYLHSNKDIGSLISKYALNYLEHQLSTGLMFKFHKNIILKTDLSYKQRIDRQHYFLLDTKISKNKKLEKFDIEYFIKATNLLNTSYNEVDGVSMPGRWIETGIKIEF